MEYIDILHGNYQMEIKGKELKNYTLCNKRLLIAVYNSSTATILSDNRRKYKGVNPWD